MSLPFLRFSHSLPCKLRVLRVPVYLQVKSNFHSRGHLLQCNTIRKPILLGHEPIRFASTESSIALSYIQKLANSESVYILQQKLIDLHDITGLPWWGVIMLSTVILRTVIILPITIHHHYVNAKIEIVEHEMDTTVKERVTSEIRKLADENYWTEREMTRKYKQRLMQEKTNLTQKHNCHAAKNLILIGIQVPIWLGMSSAIRNLTFMQPIQDVTAQIVHMELKASSFLWWSDLTLPDASYCLPIIMGLVNLLNIQVMSMSKIQKYSLLHNIFYSVVRIATVIMIFVAALVPKTVVLYWITSVLYAVLQNVLLLLPAVRKALRIPVLDNMRKHPLQHFKNKWKNFVYFFKY